MPCRKPFGWLAQEFIEVRMERRDPQHRLSGAPPTPIPIGQAGAQPALAPVPVRANQALPSANRAAQLTLRTNQGEDELQEKPLTKRSVGACVVSGVTHLLLIVILGVWTLSNADETPFLLTIANSPPDENEELETLALEADSADVESDSAPESELPLPPSTEALSELMAVGDDSPVLDSMPLFGDLALPSGKGAPGGGDAPGGGYGGIGFGDKMKAFNKQGLDLVIVFDATISMTRELNGVKSMMVRMGAGLLKKLPATRISLVAYRDENDEYTHRALPLTNDLNAINKFLGGITADGGGDTPEGVHYGVQSGMHDNKFRPAAHKLLLIFGDAPPREEQLGISLELAKQFFEQGGRVSTITTGAREPLYAFREIALAGHGEALIMEERGRIFQEILVSVFGSEHREDVVKYFDLDERSKR